MTSPDSPTTSNEVTVLGSTIKRTRDTAIILNVGWGIFLAAWVVAHFVYPLPILGWISLGFFSLAHLYQTGRSLIDHHAAINTLIPIEFQIMQAKAANEAQQQIQNFKVEQFSSKAATSSAIGMTGRKVN